MGDQQQFRLKDIDPLIWLVIDYAVSKQSF